MRDAQVHDSTSDIVFASCVLGAGGLATLLWVAAWLTATARGARPPAFGLGSMIRLIDHPGEPATAFATDLGSPYLYWTVLGLLAVLLATAAVLITRGWRQHASGRQAPMDGLATRHEATRAAGSGQLLARADVVRPGLDDPRPHDVGFRLGRCLGRDVWASIEDSVVVLGPPRSGKGLHLAIPMILDAPGAVLTTSTRPDNLVATLTARKSRNRPVGVFDPQGLVSGVESQFRWSPIHGCEVPQTAIIRATALASGTMKNVEGGEFWQNQTETVLRGFLHAAALDGRTAADLYRWSLSPSAASEAVRILMTNQAATDGWAETLAACVGADPRTSDSIWAGVRAALGCLADPRVMAAVSPRPGEALDPKAFLAAKGTLYLLGTSSGTSASANLISALIEDIIDTARHVAAGNPSGRLDPPLALVLDEVANYPLPSLPSLMSEGGGAGITTVAVLQSLAQARAKWGEHEGAAIWDSAIVKVVLGGGSNARDLSDLSALIGDRDEQTVSETRDRFGNRTFSTSMRRVPIMDTGRLRTMPFGEALLLLRSARPIVLDLQAWSDRKDGAKLKQERASLEKSLRRCDKVGEETPLTDAG